jgi:FkbH-like protein
MTITAASGSMPFTPTEPLVPTGALTPADYARHARRIREAGDGSGLRPLRMATLASYTLNFADAALTVELARQGRRLTSWYGGFGQLEQAVMDPQGELYRFAPEALVMAIRLEDVEPDAIVRFHASSGARFAALAEDLVGRLVRCAEAFRARSGAPVFVANFAAPALPPLGPFDANVAESVTDAFARANATLRERLSAIPSAFVWDYAGLVRAEGARRWTDPRLWALGRIAVASEHQPAFAAHLARTVAGALRTPAKVLVLDLDNTLWGGVVGDDGMEGIRIGDDHPGSAFKAFQRRCLALADRGVLLAVVSKNDHEVAERVFREHPEMLIRWEHLAAARINWRPKSENIVEIATELSLGSDAFVFFDDNPVEREEVRLRAPEVAVIDVPADPLSYEAALAACPLFDQTGLSAEDRARAESYRLDRERRDLSRRFESVDDFLRDLAMTAEVGPVGPSTIGRVAQLVGKTNQFNLTTRRHGQAEIAAMCASPAHAVAYLRATDRFGDQGLVCVAIVRAEGEDAVIDTFLMSCRVMNRRIEDAMMSFLGEAARALGCRRLVGDWLPTRKNGMVKDFYAQLGFARAGELPDGGERWAIELAEGVLAWPDVIARKSAP